MADIPGLGNWGGRDWEREELSGEECPRVCSRKAAIFTRGTDLYSLTFHLTFQEVSRPYLEIGNSN